MRETSKGVRELLVLSVYHRASLEYTNGSSNSRYARDVSSLRKFVDEIGDALL